jgi:outer membrane lipoprotein-sorting protein
MVHERKDPQFFKSYRLLRQCAIGVLIGACYAPLAFAEGGETEVTKTRPSNPPVAVTAPAPVAAEQAAPAQKPVSPIGAGAAWQAKPQQAAPAPATATATPAAEPAPMQESEQEMVAKVNAYFNKLTDMQGEFVQTDPDSKQRHGRFYFQRPGKARFDYASPSSLRIISDGRNLVIEDHSLNTSERYPLDVTPFKLLLSDKVDLGNDAHVLGVEQGPDVFILTVEEKDANGSGRIRLFFNKADTSLKEWIITDAQGLDTRIEVSNLDNNKKIAENLFIISAFANDRDQ